MSEENAQQEESLDTTATPLPENYAIADQFSLLAKLMEIHGENAFKAKSYATAAFTIENLKAPLAGMNEATLFANKGIGESVGKKIIQIIKTGELPALQDLLRRTPEGVLDMLEIKGLGPKKINLLWKEMQIASLPELEQACRENRVAAQKGFGAKTEQKILQSIAFIQSNQGKFYYKHVEPFALGLQAKLEATFPAEITVIAGEFRRQLPVISRLEWVTTIPAGPLKDFLLTGDGVVVQESNDSLVVKAAGQIILAFHFATAETFGLRLFENSGSDEFLSAWKENAPLPAEASEAALFEQAGLSFIPPCLRESAAILQRAKTEKFEALVQPGSIKGLIHSHSNWSDGGYTIEQMAEELIRRGFEYLVISDHSKAAAYAGGLTEDRIREQHILIDALNQKLAPFKIFKSIECDILGDGTLDYTNDVLSTFDLVITSIHSNLDMDEEKAMMRLMGAITNPYTTILGHLTGRLLLRRPGYPVNHKAIIEACAAHHVAIEINAAPSRLDIDWQWIEYALQKGVLLSINPDAHSLDEFDYIKYGSLVAQKGGLTADRNLSSFNLKEFEMYLAETRNKKRSVTNTQ